MRSDVGVDSVQHFPDLEEYVERYELAWENGGPVELADHLPPREHPEYRATVVELIRADLELSRRHGRSTRLADYVARFADVLEDRAALAQVAFEEYRLRFQAGEPVTREEYGKQFRINTSDWPAWLRHGLSRSGSPGDVADVGAAPFPAVGTRFAGFELMGELGQGACGRVYLARQCDLANRFVVLKITRRPNSEPQRLAQLQHTNIVPVYSVHREGDIQAVCMPFLGAATLASALASFRSPHPRPESGEQFLSTLAAHRQSTVPEVGVSRLDSEPGKDAASNRPTQLDALAGMSYADVAVWLAARIADGLAHAHDHGVIHRDLKPANILISDDGEPLILDFHLSALSSEPEIASTNVGGTLPYMAPEHLRAIRSGGLVDERGDIYSLGAVLYEVLTGELPSAVPAGEFNEVVERMAADRSLQVPGVRRWNRAISPDVEAIVAQCLEPQPADRYASVHDLRTDLRRHLENLPPRYAPRRSFVERIRKWTRRWPRLASGFTVGAAASVLVVGALGLILVRNQQVARLSARETWRQFADQASAAEADLAAESIDLGLARAAIEQGRRTLQSQQALDETARKAAWHRLLSPSEQAAFRNQVGRLQFRLASATGYLGRRSGDTQLIEESQRLTQLATATLGEPDPASALQQELSAARDAELGYYDEAARKLEAIVNESPTNFAAWFSLGSIHSQLGRWHKAEACYRMCVSLQPDSFWGRFYLGLARLQLGQNEEAVAEFDKALEIRPGRADALFNRALVNEKLGRFAAAERDFTASLEAGTSVTRVYFARAAVRQQLGDFAGAAQDRREGLLRLPTDELSWLARGFARLQEDPEQALADFQEALRLNPRFKPALQNGAAILAEQLGRTREAVEMMDRLVALSPGEPEPVATRGVLWARLQDRSAALVDADLALQLGDDPDTRYRVACIHALLIQPGDERHANASLQLLSQAAWQNPDYVLELIESDPDLAQLRPDPRFADLISRIAALRPKPGTG